jgi:hypothetical protein
VQVPIRYFKEQKISKKDQRVLLIGEELLGAWVFFVSWCHLLLGEELGAWVFFVSWCQNVWRTVQQGLGQYR